MYSSASASRRLLQLATAPGLLRRLGDKPYSLDSFQSSSSSSSSPPWQTQGFERVTEIRQSALKSKQCPPSELDDSNHNVFLFPGQGTQFVGMGKRLLEVPSVPDMYDRASQILNLDLLKLCLEGPQSSLNQTLHCQAAVVVTSLAAIERLYHEDPKIVERCVAAAGFSVGEITALIFSGAISFDDGIRLVKIRSEAMQHCSDLTASGMMTVFFGANHKLSLAMEASRKWVDENHTLTGPQDEAPVKPVCVVANHLYSGAKVIAGHEKCLEFIEENKSDFYLRRTRRIPVSGAFHTALMRPAVPILQEALKKMDINNPRIPVYSNVGGKTHTNSGHVLKLLPMQVVSPVKWEQSMVALFDYKHPELTPNVYECGPGNGSLSGILKAIRGKASKKANYVPV